MRLPNLESKRKRNSLWINFFERNQILKQVYKNATDLGSRISQNVRILANITQLVLFWIGIFLACLILNHLFTVRQILNRNFNNLTDFRVILFWKIILCWTVRYQKIFFFIILHRQNVKVGAFALCWKICFWERCFWERNHILNRKLWKESEFESTFSQLLKLGIENFKTCRFWNWISTWRRNLNQGFYIHQILMKKLYLENQTLFEKSLSNNQLSDQFTLQKRRSWRSRATLISFSTKSCFHFLKKNIFLNQSL